MTPRTRQRAPASAHNASPNAITIASVDIGANIGTGTPLRVYGAKKTPKQSRFPARRKVVRRPETDEPVPKLQEKQTALKKGSSEGKRKLVRVTTVQDSDDEGAEALDCEGMQEYKEEQQSPQNIERKRRDDFRTGVTQNKKSTKRRQSTMTQFAEGRTPLSDAEELEFRPVKRSKRVGVGSGEGGGKKKQQTLTQMVPGLTVVGGSSDEEDVVVEDEGRVDALDVEEESIWIKCEKEESYKPTQYIPIPALSTRSQCTRPATNRPTALPRPPTRRSRFSVLSTPEKRRVREIPSSQSPADTPLSMQRTPRSALRSPLANRSGNPGALGETPGQRKRVAFLSRLEVCRRETEKETEKEKVKKQNTRRVVLDSEDEEDDDMEGLLNEGNAAIGAEKQASIHIMDDAADAVAVGFETQALLKQIDQTCDDVDDDAAWRAQCEKDETETELRNQGGCAEGSPELGEGCFTLDGTQKRAAEAFVLNGVDGSHEDEMHKGGAHKEIFHVKEELQHADILCHHPPSDENTAIFDKTPQRIPSTPSPPPTCIKVEPLTQTPSTNLNTHTHIHATGPSTFDLDDIPTHNSAPILVPRSPTPQRSPSDSSSAAQQIQSEWASYSQYHVSRPSATLNGPKEAEQEQSQPAILPSQATTLDESSPRAHTPPGQENQQEQVLSSQQPPPLFLASSFMTQGVLGWDGVGDEGEGEEGNAGMGWEDFSIPAPPRETFWEDAGVEDGEGQ